MKASVDRVRADGRPAAGRRSAFRWFTKAALAVATALVVAAAGVCLGGEAPGGQKVQQERLGKLHGDARAFAFGYATALPFSRATGFVFSEDGCHLAYAMNLGDMFQGDKWIVVVDGQSGPEYDLACGVVFSPDGKRVAHRARKGEKRFVVVDGQPGPEYDLEPDWVPHSDAVAIVFSPDGGRVAYAAWKGDKWFAAVDGQPGPEYEVVLDIVFSPDGERVAYAAKKADKRFVVVDGQPGPEYDYVIPNGPTFGPDGTLEYLAVEGGVLSRVKHLP